MQIRPNEHFDVVIIGAGMSGLAAGIRCALFDKNVLILESHNVPGGLNSFYSFEGRKFDVGLHAVTNYVPDDVRGTPLGKLCRQLRIDRNAFGLCEQWGSRVAFPGVDLRFGNDFALLESEIEREFPGQRDRFQNLVEAVKAIDELDLNARSVSARKIVQQYLTDPILEDMIFCPLMYYGSSWEDDMDFNQFVIMFKALYFEGFARPFEGVRRIIRVLLAKYRSLGGKRKMKCGVSRIVTSANRVSAIVLDNGPTITADRIVSSAGLVETCNLCDHAPALQSRVGRLSFVETISLLSRQPRELGWTDTIVFFNDGERFEYRRPDALVDPRSGVICFPNNYHYDDGQTLEHGVLRVTAMANFPLWSSLAESDYRDSKACWFERLQAQAMKFIRPVTLEELKDMSVYEDMFTPRTVKKYTRHLEGAVYGSPDKVRRGETHLENLFVCGTDQGFLGIVGAMLSGISIVNLHVLRS